MMHPTSTERGGQLVVVAAGSATLLGDLRVPGDARGIVLFAHGSGSSRHSPRNQYVAQALQQAGLATLLIDLLTPEEEARDDLSGELRFDIGLLADRLAGATDWLLGKAATRHLQVSYFGASTGAAAALIAAAARPRDIFAVVSRGGRPDLAGAALRQVRAPTLLIVGGDDVQVVGLNHEAKDELRCEKRLVLVPGATHLFEEPGALADVAQLAADWLRRQLGRGAAAPWLSST